MNWGAGDPEPRWKGRSFLRPERARVTPWRPVPMKPCPAFGGRSAARCHQLSQRGGVSVQVSAQPVVYDHTSFSSIQESIPRFKRGQLFYL